MKFIIFFLACLVCVTYQKATNNFLSDDLITKINNHKTTWKAGRNFPIHTPITTLKHLMGVLPRDENTPKVPLRRYSVNLQDIPESFDAREAWPECADIIDEIQDQGSCGSCWAFGAAEAMSDRFCIHSNATFKTRISVEDILDCCSLCGAGCQGGWGEVAWLHWGIAGVVTGGSYESNEGCKSYVIPPCDHHVDDGSYGPCGDLKPTPACVKICDDGAAVQYASDLTRGTTYGLSNVVEEIQMDIMTNGPVEADFDVYEDFLLYKSGVYQHVEGASVGGHAIKILGWGIEDGTPYWLAANSWNSEWGDKGYFKILRGNNECGLENNMVAGLPVL